MRCHFSRQPRQQVAVACWAMKTGWFRIGVCLPSLAGSAGANRSETNCPACSRIVSRPRCWKYSDSAPRRRNRLRNRDRPNAANSSSKSRNSKNLQTTSKPGYPIPSVPVNPLAKFRGKVGRASPLAFRPCVMKPYSRCGTVSPSRRAGTLVLRKPHVVRFTETFFRTQPHERRTGPMKPLWQCTHRNPCRAAPPSKPDSPDDEM